MTEYWLIDPDQQIAHFYQLSPQPIFEAGQLDDLGRYHSEVLAPFWVKPAWVWQAPRPRAVVVLRDRGLV